MKPPETKKATARASSGRVSVTRTFTLYPEQDIKLIEAERIRGEKERNVSVSLVLQDLIDNGLDSSTGRAKTYLAARDRAIEFEEDIHSLLLKAGFRVARNAKVNGGDHRCDMLVTGPKGDVVVELKSSGKRDRMELALGQALILKNQSSLPVVVVVPVILEPSINSVFDAAGIGLVEAGKLVSWVRGAYQK